MKLPYQVLNQYLRKKNMRQSKQRNKILEVFLNSERHLTANELYETVRKKYPEIGYATVYRAMKIITEAGIAEEIEFGDGIKRFEHKYGHQHHDHLICIECGKCVEVMHPQIEKLQEELANDNGFTLLQHKMYLLGVCNECKGKTKKR